jgi:hypothetical protein
MRKLRWRLLGDAPSTALRACGIWVFFFFAFFSWLCWLESFNEPSLQSPKLDSWEISFPKSPRRSQETENLKAGPLPPFPPGMSHCLLGTVAGGCVMPVPCRFLLPGAGDTPPWHAQCETVDGSPLFGGR